jgi:ABC-type sugar transport system substrate-binding protein
VTIVVGYSPTPAGRAALTTATTEARRSDRPLVVVNTSRGDALDDPAFAQAADQEVRGREAADELIDVLEGGRGRALRDRYPPPLSRRQDGARQRAPHPDGLTLPGAHSTSGLMSTETSDQMSTADLVDLHGEAASP